MVFDMDTKHTIYGYGLYDLDPIDQKIIEFLQENGRESFSNIAAEIGVPPSTIRDRTNRMVASGVIKIVARLNPVRAKPLVKASVGIKLAGGNHRTVAQEITKMTEVSQLIIGAGIFDLLVELSCKDNDHLLDTLSSVQEMPQVQATETFMHFSTLKNELEI